MLTLDGCKQESAQPQRFCVKSTTSLHCHHIRRHYGNWECCSVDSFQSIYTWLCAVRTRIVPESTCHTRPGFPVLVVLHLLYSAIFAKMVMPIFTIHVTWPSKRRLSCTEKTVTRPTGSEQHTVFTTKTRCCRTAVRSELPSLVDVDWCLRA